MFRFNPTKLLSALLAAALISGCGSRPRHADAVASTPPPLQYPKVEIDYDADAELLVQEQSGFNGMASATGTFNPIAAIAVIGVLAANIASQATLPSRVKSRSDEFNAAIHNTMAHPDINQAYVEALAESLRESGREVKLIPRRRDVSQSVSSGAPPNAAVDGYARLSLWITTAYGAEDMTAPFHPMVAVKYALSDAQQKPVVEKQVNFKRGSPRFFTYSGLLAGHMAAYEGMKESLLGTVSEVTSAFPSPE